MATVRILNGSGATLFTGAVLEQEDLREFVVSGTGYKVFREDDGSAIFDVGSISASIDQTSPTPGVTLTLTVDAPGTLTYQWYVDDVAPGSGDTSSTFDTTGLSEGDVVTCEVSNGVQTVETAGRTLTTGTLFDFTVEPDGEINVLLREDITGGHRFTLSGTANNRWIWWVVTGLTIGESYTFRSDYTKINTIGPGTLELSARVGGFNSGETELNDARYVAATDVGFWNPSVTFTPTQTTVYLGWQFSGATSDSSNPIIEVDNFSLELNP